MPNESCHPAPLRAIPDPLSTSGADLDRLESEVEAIIARFDDAVQARPLADALGPEITGTMRRICDQVRQHRIEPFTVVFIGAFKRGKSSLLNAVIGAPVAATSCTPETIAITEIRYGPQFKADLRLTDGSRIPIVREDLPAGRLEAFVEPLGNRFSHLEVQVPLPELADIRWVDTPGTGDLFSRFDERVQRYLAAADLIVVVLSPTSPLSASEQAFLRAAIPAHDSPKVVFALNMIDFVRTAEEAQRLTAAMRARCAALFPGAPLFPLSAQDELARRLGWKRPSPAQAEAYAALFDVFRGMLVDTMFANRRVIRLDRIAALGSTMLAWFTERVALLHTTLEADREQVERGLAVYQDDEGAGATQRAEQKAALQDELAALHQQTVAWIEQFLNRLEREALPTIVQAAPDDIDRHFQFFIADRLRQALDACLAAQQPVLDAAVRRISNQLRRDLAAQFNMGDVGPLTAATRFENPHWDGEQTLITLADLLFGMGTLAGILGVASQGARQNRLTGDAVARIRQAMPQLRPPMMRWIDGIYTHLGNAVAEQLDTTYEQNRSDILTAVRQITCLRTEGENGADAKRRCAEALDLARRARGDLDAIGNAVRMFEAARLTEPPLLTVAKSAPTEPPSAAQETEEICVFVSYSHEDQQFVHRDAPNSLLRYLAPLEQEGFRFWCDDEILSGETWDDRIHDELTRADIALVLVSQTFLGSRYCTAVEVTSFLEARRQRGLIILPIVVSCCDWKSQSWLAETQFLPRDGRALSELKRAKRERLYLKVLGDLREHGRRLRLRRSRP